MSEQEIGHNQKGTTLEPLGGVMSPCAQKWKSQGNPGIEAASQLPEAGSHDHGNQVHNWCTYMF